MATCKSHVEKTYVLTLGESERFYLLGLLQNYLNGHVEDESEFEGAIRKELFDTLTNAEDK